MCTETAMRCERIEKAVKLKGIFSKSYIYIYNNNNENLHTNNCTVICKEYLSILITTI